MFLFVLFLKIFNKHPKVTFEFSNVTFGCLFLPSFSPSFFKKSRQTQLFPLLYLFHFFSSLISHTQSFFFPAFFFFSFFFISPAFVLLSHQPHTQLFSFSAFFSSLFFSPQFFLLSQRYPLSPEIQTRDPLVTFEF
jgi:hypothetical protein